MIIHKEQISFFDPKTGTQKKKLVVSYVNKDGKISFLQYDIPETEMFQWKYTTRKFADPYFKSYDNKFVKKVPCKELNDYRVNELLCSFGSQADPIYEMNYPITWFCDIETDVNELGFPDSDNAINPINTIAITKFPKTIVFGRKHLLKEEIEYIQNKLKSYSNLTKDYEFEYKEYSNEYQMLIDFISFIKPIPAITGWNFIGYDWKYIYNRCKKLSIDIEDISPTRKFQKFKVTLKNGMKISADIPLHKIIYDYLIVYKQWDRSIEIKENDTLDFVAEKTLGIKKVKHNVGFQEFYKDYYKDYVFYNSVDTILVEQIDKKIKTANIWYMMSSILRTELNKTFSTINPIETVITHFIYKDHKVLVKKNFDETTNNKESYIGAFVWPTIPGIYRNIGGLDFASLYPSIMRQFQISPETFLFKDETKNYKPKENEIMTSSGAVFRKDPNAIIPSILTYYYAQRKEAKKEKKIANQEYEELKHILEKRKKLI